MAQRGRASRERNGPVARAIYHAAGIINKFVWRAINLSTIFEPIPRLHGAACPMANATNSVSSWNANSLTRGCLLFFNPLRLVLFSKQMIFRNRAALNFLKRFHAFMYLRKICRILKSTKVKSIVEKQKFIYTFILSDILIIKLNKWEQIQIILHLLLRDQTHLRSNFIARKIFRITFLRLRTRATYGGKG